MTHSRKEFALRIIGTIGVVVCVFKSRLSLKQQAGCTLQVNRFRFQVSRSRCNSVLKILIQHFQLTEAVDFFEGRARRIDQIVCDSNRFLPIVV